MVVVYLPFVVCVLPMFVYIFEEFKDGQSSTITKITIVTSVTFSHNCNTSIMLMDSIFLVKLILHLITAPPHLCVQEPLTSTTTMKKV